MNSFQLTYDRHQGKYGKRTQNFPKEYSHYDASFDYANDPDWSVKIGTKRANLKMWIFYGAVIFWLGRQRLNAVSQFDKMKREE